MSSSPGTPSSFPMPGCSSSDLTFAHLIYQIPPPQYEPAWPIERKIAQYQLRDALQARIKYMEVAGNIGAPANFHPQGPEAEDVFHCMTSVKRRAIRQDREERKILGFVGPEESALRQQIIALKEDLTYFERWEMWQNAVVPQVRTATQHPPKSLKRSRADVVPASSSKRPRMEQPELYDQYQFIPAPTAQYPVVQVATSAQQVPHVDLSRAQTCPPFEPGHSIGLGFDFTDPVAHSTSAAPAPLPVTGQIVGEPYSPVGLARTQSAPGSFYNPQFVGDGTIDPKVLHIGRSQSSIAPPVTASLPVHTSVMCPTTLPPFVPKQTVKFPDPTPPVVPTMTTFPVVESFGSVWDEQPVETSKDFEVADFTGSDFTIAFTSEIGVSEDPVCPLPELDVMPGAIVPQNVVAADSSDPDLLSLLKLLEAETSGDLGSIESPSLFTPVELPIELLRAASP